MTSILIVVTDYSNENAYLISTYCPNKHLHTSTYRISDFSMKYDILKGTAMFNCFHQSCKTENYKTISGFLKNEGYVEESNYFTPSNICSKNIITYPIVKETTPFIPIKKTIKTDVSKTEIVTDGTTSDK